MPDPRRVSQPWFLAAIIIASAALGVAGAMLVAAQRGEGGDEDPFDPAVLTPPPYNRWIRPDTGEFHAYVWDDRPISEAEKAAQPWYDPRWKPFGDCMVAAGYDVREDPGAPFGQQDLDRIVELANTERPDREANRFVGARIETVDGIAGAFLRCAGEWLALRHDQWEAHGIRELAPGEVPEP